MSIHSYQIRMQNLTVSIMVHSAMQVISSGEHAPRMRVEHAPSLSMNQMTSRFRNVSGPLAIAVLGAKASAAKICWRRGHHNLTTSWSSNKVRATNGVWLETGLPCRANACVASEMAQPNLGGFPGVKDASD